MRVQIPYMEPGWQAFDNICIMSRLGPMQPTVGGASCPALKCVSLIGIIRFDEADYSESEK